MSAIYVVGSINFDLTVQADRRPKPGETVLGNDVQFVLGGKGANQAIAAARLGSNASLIGRVGDDHFGDRLLERLQEEPLDVSRVRVDTSATTGLAFITVDDRSENSIIVIPGANDAVSPTDVEAAQLTAEDIAVSQFEIPQPTIRRFFEIAAEKGATCLLNPAPAKSFAEPILPLVDYLVVNEHELSFYSDVDREPPLTEEVIADTCKRLRAHDEQVIVVTLGADGVLASTPAGTIRHEGHSTDTVDTTGAGDAFVGALATALAEDRRLSEALAFANSAGAVATTTFGASESLPVREQIEPHL